mmetsp:Transcript_46060/g.109495  ORF Transcript_46060/g.109495 Transcript_46060/m.109495 type:complete len:271 (-) Transcript_46060:101-913(-)
MALSKFSTFSQSQVHASSWSESHLCGRRDRRDAKVTALNSESWIWPWYLASSRDMTSHSSCSREKFATFFTMSSNLVSTIFIHKLSPKPITDALNSSISLKLVGICIFCLRSPSTDGSCLRELGGRSFSAMAVQSVSGSSFSSISSFGSVCSFSSCASASASASASAGFAALSFNFEGVASSSEPSPGGAFGFLTFRLTSFGSRTSSSFSSASTCGTETERSMSAWALSFVRRLRNLSRKGTFCTSSSSQICSCSKPSTTKCSSPVFIRL